MKDLFPLNGQVPLVVPLILVLLVHGLLLENVIAISVPIAVMETAGTS